MSNIYITEPTTEGKVLLHTSFGDLDVELWPREAPKACRNFVQLCLEGYYDNTIFHRIIKSFMVQGGDPSGTGQGGESIYGAPFADEFHSRLRFNHRGLLAMANANQPNSNHSQFFFTLDACEFLNKKHTIFGKITGNTIFNLLSVGEVETDSNDRPLNPPTLRTCEVLWNPFEDIVPRSIKPKADAASKTNQNKKRKATKDLKLLSFGHEEEQFGHETARAKVSIASSHDLLQDAKLSKRVDASLLQTIEDTNKSKRDQSTRQVVANSSERKPKKLGLKEAVANALNRTKGTDQDVDQDQPSLAQQEQEPPAIQEDKKPDNNKIKNKNKKSKQQDKDEYTQLREELRKNKSAVAILKGDKAKDLETSKALNDMLTPLQQQRQKYLSRKKSTLAGRQSDTLQKLDKFKQLLKQAKEQTPADQTASNQEAYHGQVLEKDEEEEEEEDDANAQGSLQAKDWMTAKLKFKKHIDDQFRQGYDPSADDYMTIDTRTEPKRESSRRY